MERRYHTRWPLLISVVVVLGVLPLIAWLAFGADILPFAILALLILAVGGGGAGLRKWWGEDPSDVAERETDHSFERPRDEGRLL
jgi:hypothetical protein